MSTIQYAVSHLQQGRGNDSGILCHIERKTADGKVYVPGNADKTRTHVNRELIQLLVGVRNHTDAAQYRIEHARLHRKVDKNQTKAIRIIIIGSHKQMIKIVQQRHLDKRTDAKLRWLRDTFGVDNVVSSVLHIDEKKTYLHTTVVPIVTGKRKRKFQIGNNLDQQNFNNQITDEELVGHAVFEP